MIYALATAAVTMMGAVVAFPVIIFAAECMAGSWPARRKPTANTNQRPPVSVLIPAHNEALGIAETLRSIRGEARAGDRVVVVADNCDDRTAEIARGEGAEVVERHDAQRRGKGFALAAGIEYLRLAPTEIVVFVDADCKIAAGTLDSLAADVVATGRPIQALNLQIAPARSSVNIAVAEFAFLIKNKIRPLGLKRLGFPCLLTGTGMALPWSLLQNFDLATGHQVEDMKFAIDLTKTGHAPRFCERAKVTSYFPQSQQGAETQRRRWEGGHIAMMRFALTALAQPRSWRNLDYLILLLDIMVPPLTLLGTLVLCVMILTGAAGLLGLNFLPLAIAGASAILFTVAIAVCWMAHGRSILPAAKLARLPVYAVTKMTRYPRTLLSADPNWVRTDRAGPQHGPE